MLLDNLKNSERLLKPEIIINNLNRNINYIVKNRTSAPEINIIKNSDNLQYSSDIDSMDDLDDTLITNDYPDLKYRYSILLLQNTNGLKLSAWLIHKKYTLAFNTEIWNVIFQIAAACYAMSLTKMVHNDLHYGNIFVEELKTPIDFLYTINDIPILIRTKYKVLLFDYDRAFVERLGDNSILTTKSCEEISQCNKFIENKDIVKIFCYISKLSKISNELLDLLTENPIIKDILKTVYNFEDDKGRKRCFLQYKKDTALSSTIYDSINNPYTILIEIYSKYLTKFNNDNMLSVNENNKYNCNLFMFDEDGNINL